MVRHRWSGTGGPAQVVRHRWSRSGTGGPAQVVRHRWSGTGGQAQVVRRGPGGPAQVVSRHRWSGTELVWSGTGRGQTRTKGQRSASDSSYVAAGRAMCLVRRAIAAIFPVKELFGEQRRSRSYSLLCWFFGEQRRSRTVLPTGCLFRSYPLVGRFHNSSFRSSTGAAPEFHSWTVPQQQLRSSTAGRFHNSSSAVPQQQLRSSHGSSNSSNSAVPTVLPTAATPQFPRFFQQQQLRSSHGSSHSSNWSEEPKIQRSSRFLQQEQLRSRFFQQQQLSSRFFQQEQLRSRRSRGAAGSSNRSSSAAGTSSSAAATGAAPQPGPAAPQPQHEQLRSRGQQLRSRKQLSSRFFQHEQLRSRDQQLSSAGRDRRPPPQVGTDGLRSDQWDLLRRSGPTASARSKAFCCGRVCPAVNQLSRSIDVVRWSPKNVADRPLQVLVHIFLFFTTTTTTSSCSLQQSIRLELVMDDIVDIE